MTKCLLLYIFKINLCFVLNLEVLDQKREAEKVINKKGRCVK